MIPYTEALKQVLDAVQPMEQEEKPLLQALGQVLAEDIHASLDLPRTPTGGPDGYAVRAEDIRDAGKERPVTLRIIGTVRAGQMPRKAVRPGTAIRTMTGSVLPEGADCVVRFEDTDEPGDKNGPNPHKPTKVKIYTAIERGANVSKPGAQIAKGTLAVPKGTVIGPAQVSVITQLGLTRVKVHRRPVIAILSSGDELARPGSRLAPGKIFDCNSDALASFVKLNGGIPKMLGIARDREASILSKLAKGLEADAIISSGGVSKGDYDLTRLVITKLGALLFSRIKMGPGAAVAFGLLDNPAHGRRTPLFALSGPPMGCMINFETLVRPALLKMLGRSDTAHPALLATLDEAMPDKRSVAFVKWTKLEKEGEGYRVRFDPGGKSMLATLASADSLTILPENTSFEADETVTVLPFGWGAR